MQALKKLKNRESTEKNILNILYSFSIKKNTLSIVLPFFVLIQIKVTEEVK